MNLFPKIYATTGNVGIRSMLAIPKVFVSYGSALKCLAVHVYSSMHIAHCWLSHSNGSARPNHRVTVNTAEKRLYGAFRREYLLSASTCQAFARKLDTRSGTRNSIRTLNWLRMRAGWCEAVPDRRVAQ